jgi:hypothetical protein
MPERRGSVGEPYRRWTDGAEELRLETTSDGFSCQEEKVLSLQSIQSASLTDSPIRFVHGEYEDMRQKDELSKHSLSLICITLAWPSGVITTRLSSAHATANSRQGR